MSRHDPHPDTETFGVPIPGATTTEQRERLASPEMDQNEAILDLPGRWDLLSAHLDRNFPEFPLV